MPISRFRRCAAILMIALDSPSLAGDGAAVDAYDPSEDPNNVRVEVLIGGVPMIGVNFSTRVCIVGEVERAFAPTETPTIQGSAAAAAIERVPTPISLKYTFPGVFQKYQQVQDLTLASGKPLSILGPETLYTYIFEHCDVSGMTLETWRRGLSGWGRPLSRPRASREGMVALAVEWLAWNNDGYMPCFGMGPVVNGRTLCERDLVREAGRCVNWKKCDVLWEWLHVEHTLPEDSPRFWRHQQSIEGSRSPDN